MKLSFLIAGVQKGATTALHHYLRQHPDLYLPAKKELHFFDNEKIDWSAPPYGEVYHSHFQAAPSGTLWGEATPIYTYWQPSAGRIHRYNPQIKLIVSLRDPAARAYSHWRMEAARNAETLDFPQAIREGRNRVIDEAEIPGQHSVFSYVERGFYTEQINRILIFFERKQLFFLTTHELFNRYEETLDRICTFLEVPHFRDYPNRRFVFSHKNNDIASPHRDSISYLRKLYQDNLVATEQLTGKKIRQEII